MEIQLQLINVASYQSVVYRIQVRLHAVAAYQFRDIQVSDGAPILLSLSELQNYV